MRKEIDEGIDEEMAQKSAEDEAVAATEPVERIPPDDEA